MITITDFLLSFLLNALPLLILFLIYFLIRKEAAKKIYLRFCLSILLFYLIYFILPALFQFNASEIVSIDGGSGSVSQGVIFLIIRALSMIITWLHYPIVIFPFVFTIAPVLSLLILIRNLKEEEGTLQEKLNALNYEYNKSPGKYFAKNITQKGWDKEKEMFKAMIILLPISLYFLTVILELAGIEATSIENSETAIGWFLEIMFVYVTTFLLSFQLLVSAKISISGKYLGEKVKNNLFHSLNEVGTPIAIISILLFIAQNRDNPGAIGLVFYFLAYFMMATFTFVLLMRVFEPFSILLLIKTITWYISIKSRNKKTKADRNDPEQKLIRKDILITNGIVIGISAIMVLILIFVGSFVSLGQTIFIEKWAENPFDFIKLAVVGEVPSLELVLDTEIVNVINSIGIQVITILFAYFFSLAISKTKSVLKAMTHYGGFLIILTILLSPFYAFSFPLNWTFDVAWMTGSPIMIKSFGFDFYTARTAFLTANFEDNLFLTIITYPFIIMNSLASFALWGTIIYFGRKDFRTYTLEVTPDTMERITFTQINGYPQKHELIQNNAIQRFLITRNSDIIEDKAELLNALFNKIGSGALTDQLILPNMSFDLYYEMLRKLSVRKLITFWNQEFSYSYKKPKLDALYIMTNDGRDLFTYEFSEGCDPNPA